MDFSILLIWDHILICWFEMIFRFANLRWCFDLEAYLRALPVPTIWPARAMSVVALMPDPIATPLRSCETLSSVWASPACYKQEAFSDFLALRYCWLIPDYWIWSADTLNRIQKPSTTLVAKVISGQFYDEPWLTYQSLSSFTNLQESNLIYLAQHHFHLNLQD